MAKVYFISVYRQVKDPEKLAAYAKLAGPAIEAGGGRFLARGVAAKAYEAGQLERTVLIEFESVEQVTAMYETGRPIRGRSSAGRRGRAGHSDHRGSSSGQGAWRRGGLCANGWYWARLSALFFEAMTWTLPPTLPFRAPRHAPCSSA